MQTTRHAGLVLALFPLTVLVIARPAAAQTLLGNYFEVPEADPDFGRGADFGTVTGLVQNTLGPDGLPVVTALGSTYNGPSGPITDVNKLGELQWWSTGTRTVSGTTFTELFDTSAVTTIPFAFDQFYPTGQNSDSNFFRTVEWTGTFTLSSPQVANFFLGADDDAWLFVDGQLTVDDGGVKADAPVATNTTTLSAGKHTFALFYDDRDAVDAQITFSSSVNLSAAGPSFLAPEPSDLALLTFGLLPLGYAIRRRNRTAV